MRHGKKFNHLGRTDSHRAAMLSNMATSLIMHKRVTTTVAKAKALRLYVEPLLTKSKTDTTHNRRIVFSYLQDKESVTVLFREVATKIAERNGGYTRIIKTGTRFGDAAEMCFIELVDYNEIYNPKGEVKKAKTTRRGRTSAAKTAPANSAPANTEPKPATPKSATAQARADSTSKDKKAESQTGETPHTDAPAEGSEGSEESK